MKFSKEIIQTQDGSFTIRINDLKETYHSKSGAITESNFVYIEAGLNYWFTQHSDSQCRVLELGYGTGLMTYLSFLECEKKLQTVDYVSLEAYPLKEEQLKSLEYTPFFEDLDPKINFDIFSCLDWEMAQKLSDHFSLTKHKIRFEEFEANRLFDLIYYDAFGSHAQAELWEPQWVEKCFRLLNSGGVWVSYCAKGSVRRGLEEAGFQVSRLPGPPGKREMLRAVKP